MSKICLKREKAKTNCITKIISIFKWGVDLRSRHFAFRGAELSLLAASGCGVSTLPLQSRRSLRALHSNQQVFKFEWQYNPENFNIQLPF
ncbi:uroporphyrinogen decarboxylase [Bacillus sp. NRRL B-14911]|nr:uroporphyrinogen decarboxylase [Bacillus sp. NRRL B-14911]